jgi:sugar phosphate isomerase/epimerase
MIKLAFMSSTCPEWSFEQMVDAAKRYGYDGVDLRVEWKHHHGLELDSTKEARRRARQYAADQGIAIACVALSTRFARAAAEERAAEVEGVKRYAELAADLGAKVMRVFGGPIPQGHTMHDLRPSTAAALGQAAAAAEPFGVTPCLETHDAHNNPADVAWIVEHANHQNVGVVWHPAHHLRLGIPVDDAYGMIGKWVRHLHLQDWPKGGLPAGERPGFLPIGEGDNHLARVFELLQRGGFDGYASNEWIIKQHSELNPDEHLPRASKHLHAWRDAAQRAA